MVRAIAVFLVLVGSASFANDNMFGSPSYVTLTGSSVQVLPQNTLREYLILVNTGNGTAYVTFGTPNTLGAPGIPIPSLGNYEPRVAPSNSIYMFSPSGSNITVLQGQ